LSRAAGLLFVATLVVLIANRFSIDLWAPGVGSSQFSELPR